MHCGCAASLGLAPLFVLELGLGAYFLFPYLDGKLLVWPSASVRPPAGVWWYLKVDTAGIGLV